MDIAASYGSAHIKIGQGLLYIRGAKLGSLGTLVTVGMAGPAVIRLRNVGTPSGTGRVVIGALIDFGALLLRI